MKQEGNEKEIVWMAMEIGEHSERVMCCGCFGPQIYKGSIYR